MPQTQIGFETDNLPFRSYSPFLELGAYEALWLKPKRSFRTMAKLFAENPGQLPSEFICPAVARKTAARVLTRFKNAGVTQKFGLKLNGADEYPARLRDARNPVELLYYEGWWNLVETGGVAVVGARKVSENGKRRTRKIVKALVKDGWTIISGLAEGVDTEAHETAIACGGRTIAVLGTPLSETYPKKNKALHREVAENHLVISQVPVERYSSQDYRINRSFFPERNITMSALSAATIIVEAGNTSGTLYQARAALSQGRKLFIMESCFQHPGLTWPHQFEKKGAIRLRDFEQFRREFEDEPSPSQD